MKKKKKWFLFIDSPHTNFWLYIFINLSLPSPVCGDGETCPISLVVSHLSPRFYPLIFSIFLTRTVESLRINVEDTPPLLLASTSLPNCFFFFNGMLPANRFIPAVYKRRGCAPFFIWIFFGQRGKKIILTWRLKDERALLMTVCVEYYKMGGCAASKIGWPDFCLLKKKKDGDVVKSPF